MIASGSSTPTRPSLACGGAAGRWASPVQLRRLAPPRPQRPPARRSATAWEIGRIHRDGGGAYGAPGSMPSCRSPAGPGSAASGWRGWCAPRAGGLLPPAPPSQGLPRRDPKAAPARTCASGSSAHPGRTAGGTPTTPSCPPTRAPGPGRGHRRLLQAGGGHAMVSTLMGAGERRGGAGRVAPRRGRRRAAPPP